MHEMKLALDRGRQVEWVGIAQPHRAVELIHGVGDGCPGRKQSFEVLFHIGIFERLMRSPIEQQWKRRSGIERGDDVQEMREALRPIFPGMRGRIFADEGGAVVGAIEPARGSL